MEGGATATPAFVIVAQSWQPVRPALTTAKTHNPHEQSRPTVQRLIQPTACSRAFGVDGVESGAAEGVRQRRGEGVAPEVRLRPVAEQHRVMAPPPPPSPLGAKSMTWRGPSSWWGGRGRFIKQFVQAANM